jgi:hypothetical protein
MAWEAFVGVLFGSVFSATFFGKVARIQSVAQIRWSHPICVRYGTGVKGIRHRASGNYSGDSSRSDPPNLGNHTNDITRPIDKPTSAKAAITSQVPGPSDDDCSSSSSSVVSSVAGKATSPGVNRKSTTTSGPVLSALEAFKAAVRDRVQGGRNTADENDVSEVVRPAIAKPKSLQDIVLDAHQKHRRRKVWPCPILEFRIVNELANETGGEIMDASIKVVATTLASAGIENEVAQDVYHLLHSTTAAYNNNSIINNKSVPHSTRKLLNLTSTLSKIKHNAPGDGDGSHNSSSSYDLTPSTSGKRSSENSYLAKLHIPSLPFSTGNRSARDTAHAGEFEDSESSERNNSSNHLSMHSSPSPGTPRTKIGTRLLHTASIGMETVAHGIGAVASVGTKLSRKKESSGISNSGISNDPGMSPGTLSGSLLSKLNHHLKREKMSHQGKKALRNGSIEDDSTSNLDTTETAALTDSVTGSDEAALTLSEEDLEKELQNEVECRLALELRKVRASIEESTKQALAAAAAKAPSVKCLDLLLSRKEMLMTNPSCD